MSLWYGDVNVGVKLLGREVGLLVVWMIGSFCYLVIVFVWVVIVW